SIDRMPLGDMAATMTALIGGNPSIDFVYTRRIDGRELTADTREFREVLAGVPLDTPEVLAFITEYINENTTEILQEEDII
ncbi:MAG: ATP-binding protein, partial [Angelakisella sp.]